MIEAVYVFCMLNSHGQVTPSHLSGYCRVILIVFIQIMTRLSKLCTFPLCCDNS
jgi:hypothetical protein